MAPQNIQNSLEKEIPIENHQFFGGPMFVFRWEFLGSKTAPQSLSLAQPWWLSIPQAGVCRREKSSSHQPAIPRPAEKVGLDMLNM